MLDIERLLEPIPDLRLDLAHHEHEQVADSVVEDEVGCEGLSECIDEGQAVQGVDDEQFSCFFDLSWVFLTFYFCRQSKRVVVPIMMISRMKECR